MLGLSLAESHGRRLRKDYILVTLCFPEICGLGFCEAIKRQAWCLPKVERLLIHFGLGMLQEVFWSRVVAKSERRD